MHAGGGILDITVLTFCLLFVAALVSIATKRIRLPLSVALVVLGLLAGLAAQLLAEGHGLLASVAASIRDIHLTPELILFIFLPTLLFESAYNLDVRELFRNLAAILMLAIPGLVLSTFIIGALLHWLLDLSFAHALLFGAMISATDPVAVIAIFKKVGAPRRLVTLVEGESLCNDATAIVFFGLIFTLIEGHGATAPGVLGRFLLVFLGGTAVGAGMAYVFARIIEQVENDLLVEITLTTVLAYLSFIVADHFLHVSGVMSTVAAGLVIGSYGRTKISAEGLEFMHPFWEYMAYVANAIVFLLVGLFLPGAIGADRIAGLALPVAIAVLAALLARGVVVFSLVPLITALRLSEPVNTRYQSVIFWGGLRGAIALTLALSLLGRAALPSQVADQLLALTAGVVLFTLLVNALSIRRLVHFLGLDRETRAERLLRAESMLTVQREVQRDLQGLRTAGVLLPRVVENLLRRTRDKREEIAQDLATDAALPFAELLAIHRLQLLGIEKKHTLALYAQGNLGETATRQLCSEAEAHATAIRKGTAAARVQREPVSVRWPIVSLLRRVPGLRNVAQRLQMRRVALLYETALGRMLTSRTLLSEISRLRGAEAVSEEVCDTLLRDTLEKRRHAEEEMDEIAHQYPEFVNKVQELMGNRIMLNTERQGYEHLLEQGLINEEVFQRLTLDLDHRYHALERRPVKALDLSPRSLLATVPLFAGLSPEELDALAACLRPRSCVKGEVLFREGEEGDTMYLIGRGVVKVWRGSEDDKIPVATLTSGNFVGEMALLHPAPRTASVTTATVASVLELKKADLDRVLEDHPDVSETLESAYQDRHTELEELERAFAREHWSR